MKDQAGKVSGLVFSLRDATRYKEAELERQRAGEMLRRERDFGTAVIETAGALVIVLDEAGNIMRFNRECELVSRYSTGEVLGKSVWERAIFVTSPAEPVRTYKDHRPRTAAALPRPTVPFFSFTGFPRPRRGPATWRAAGTSAWRSSSRTPCLPGPPRSDPGEDLRAAPSTGH